MDKDTVNCEIVKDLIPLYSEGLCSEISRAAVESHIAGCESCRRLLNTPIEREKPAPVPTEKNVFKKLSRRLKMNMAVMISLGVVLLGVLGVVGYLSVGQMVRGDGMVSFETISQSIEVKKLAKMIADKDFRGYLDSTYCGGIINGGLVTDFGGNAEYEKIQEHNAAEFGKLYDEIIGDRAVKKITADAKYGRYSEFNRYSIETYATIVFEDDTELELAFIKENDNRYTGDIVGARGIDIKAYNDLTNGFEMINYTYDDFRKRIVEAVLAKGIEDTENKVNFITHFFAMDHWDEMSAALTDFYNKGYTITDCTISRDIYDEEYDRYSNIWITARDGSGTAVFKGRIYRDIKGFKPPCDIEIYADGCTDELAESLAKMFG